MTSTSCLGFLLSIGRGIEDRDNISQFERLAEKMEATLAVSRPLVDSGWIPNSPGRAVGQDGEAQGLSGAGNLGAVASRPESQAQRRSSQ